MSNVNEDGSKVLCDCGRNWSAPWGESCPECGAELPQAPVEAKAEAGPGEAEKPKATVQSAAKAVAERFQSKKSK